MRAYVRTIGCACALLSTLTACESIFGSGGTRVVGILQLNASAAPDPRTGTKYPGGAVPLDELEAVVTVPDTVQAGVDFNARIATVGLGACYEAAGAETELSANLAVVTPFDRVKGSEDEDELVCTLAAVTLPRTVRLRFSEPGEAVVRVKGRKIIGGDVRNATETVLERRIVVR